MLIDLFVIHRHPHKIRIGEAIAMSAFWVGLWLAFNAWFGWHYGREVGLQFLTGYLVEKN